MGVHITHNGDFDELEAYQQVSGWALHYIHYYCTTTIITTTITSTAETNYRLTCCCLLLFVPDR